MSKMMRVSEATAINLEKLSKDLGKSKKAILEKAVEAYVREQFLIKANKAYEAFSLENPELYKEEQAEIKDWDFALSEGLEGDE